jgi:hypothetical protein
MEITITGTLRNDQTAGLQDNDFAISGDLTGLNSTFRTFLLGLSGDLALSAGQLAFADNVEAARTSSTFVTVDAQGSNISNLFFSDGAGALLNGDQVFISAGVPLQTVDGSNVYLHSYAGGDIVLATTSATEGVGDVVAAFYLNEAINHLSAGVEMVTFIPIKHPDATNPDDSINWTNLLNVSGSGSLTLDFDQLHSGESLWVAVGSPSGAVLVTGSDLLVDGDGKKTNASDKIVVSQGGTGTTIGMNNQLWDASGEKAVFTLVTGLDTLSGADDGAQSDYVLDHSKPSADGIDYSGYINTTGAGIFISQSQGTPTLPKDFNIQLLTAGGGTTAEDLGGYIPGLASDALVNVATVTITDDDGHVVGTWVVGADPDGAGPLLGSGATVHNVSGNSGAAGNDVQVTISGSVIDVNGVLGEYTVDWTSTGTFNRFTLDYQAGKFDVGAININNVTGDTKAVGGSLFVDDDGPSIGDIANSIVDFATGASGTVERVPILADRLDGEYRRSSDRGQRNHPYGDSERYGHDAGYECCLLG